MITNRIALDTNVLIYTHSLDCKSKKSIARGFFNQQPVVFPLKLAQYYKRQTKIPLIE